MEAELDPPEAQALFRALQRPGLAPRVRAPDPRCAGLGWYDRLPRIRSLAVIAVVDGRTCAPEAVPVPEGAIREPRPEAVVMKFRVAHPPAPGRKAACEETRTLPADLAFAGAPWAWVGAARPAGDARLRHHPRDPGGAAPRRVLLPLPTPRTPTRGRRRARASTRRRCTPRSCCSPPMTRPAVAPSPARWSASCSGCSPPTGRRSSPCTRAGSPSPSAPTPD